MRVRNTETGLSVGWAIDMTSWLLSWNPKNWDWRTFKQDRATTASGGIVNDTWSCANGSAVKGDDVYLVRIGEEPKGIIARGKITEGPHQAPHYDPSRAAAGEQIQKVGVAFNDVRDPDQDEFIQFDILWNEVDPNQTWAPQSSGIALSDLAANKLQTLWSSLPKTTNSQFKNIFTEDCRTLSKYEHAGQGSWTAMPAADKRVYIKIYNLLERIVINTLSDLSLQDTFDTCSTLGFKLSSGVRGNRPKDLWCAIFPRGAEAYMPQVYVIVSHRGVELGYAAAIHARDFTDATFKRKLKILAPQIFDVLPNATSDVIRDLSLELARQGGWYLRRKTRLTPRENDFDTVEGLVSFLKSPEGKEWGAGTITRYWLPHELTETLDLEKEFREAVNIFKPLMVRPEATITAPPREAAIQDEPPSTAASNDIRRDLELFMQMYPERRLRPFATDQELWSILNNLREALRGLPAVRKRQAINVSWSVGRGVWAKVPCNGHDTTRCLWRLAIPGRHVGSISDVHPGRYRVQKNARYDRRSPAS